MTILFNCTTNNVGGGMKNSALFIIESLKDNSINWIYAISNGVAGLLKAQGVSITENFTVFNESPARSKESRKELTNLASETKADMVYTMAGPAYVKFSIPHIQGLSNAYITHTDFSVYKLYKNVLKRLKLQVNSKIRLMYSKNADQFIFQTEEARNGFCNKAKIDKKRTHVVSNAFDEDMQRELSDLPIKNISKEKITIFCPGAPYIHKGFQYIPSIAKELLNFIQVPFEFVLTLPNSDLLTRIESDKKRLGVENYIKNHGAYEYSEIADLYAEADIVFVPSLLETFSATYLEAIVAKKNLIVADKGFAREVCGDIAFYVDPQNPIGTAKKIARVSENKKIDKEFLQKRKNVLSKYGNQKGRYLKIKEVLINYNQNE